MKNTRAIAIELEFQSILDKQNLAANSAYDKRYSPFQRFNYLKSQINKAVLPAGLKPDYNEPDVAVEIRHTEPHRWSLAEAKRIRHMVRGLASIKDELDIYFEPEWNGLHVHVDVRDFNVRQMRNLMLWVQALEPFIFKEIDPGRRNNWFCDATKFSHLEYCYNSVEDLIYRAYCKPNSPKVFKPSLERLKEDEKNSCRFCGANFHSYLIRGSVEFRYFEATLDHNKVVQYINFCHNLVSIAAKMPPKNAGIKSFKRMFQAI